MTGYKSTEENIPVKAHGIHRFRDGILSQTTDYVAIEEPLQININGQHVSITMRTPGDDIALSIGFLFTEGLIYNANDIQKAENTDINTVDIITKNDKVAVRKIERNFYSTSSCGVCGKTSIDQIVTKSQYSNFDQHPLVQSRTLLTLQDNLRDLQKIFEMTGGLHACALFDLEGNYITHNEDVGRHNALDKLIGNALQNGMLPLDKHILLLSGRASFELIQKSFMAGIQIVAAVGAPSSLAVSLADTNNITLVGFLKNTGFNLYTHPERILWEK